MKSMLIFSGNVTGIGFTNSSFEVDETFRLQGVTILLIILISFFIFITVLGNSLVIAAFIEDKRLWSRSNFFLLNLAICDFFIGAFCIPLYVPYFFTGKWMLGKFLCKLWLVVDNLMCTASAFNVVLISYDRFLAVTMAVVYHTQQQQHCKTVLTMVAVWILSSLLYSPAILLWDYFNDNSIPEGLCLPSYYYSWHFLLGTSTFDFLLPLLSISFFNLSIYWNIKMRRQRIEAKTIAKSLSVLVCVFCFCWAPYSLLMTTRASCHDYCIASYWYEITFWLLWINSLINPILYPLCHKSFRRAFMKVICKYCIYKTSNKSGRTCTVTSVQPEN